MPKPKQALSKTNKIMHYSVGAVIQKDHKYLLIDRAILPFGFASLAGHIDEGESPETALQREVKEESGLTLTSCKLLLEEEIPWNTCSKGIEVHYWYVYECKVSGRIQRNVGETKSIGWYLPEQIRKLKLEQVWKYWFEKIGVV